MYRVTQYNQETGKRYLSPAMTLHECLLHINVFMAGLVYWKTEPVTVANALAAGYRIVKE